MDAYDNIISVKEYTNGTSYITSYKYDVTNQLTEIQDSKNNKIRYTYDSIGRKTKLEDPDLGIWTYSYDSNGNLIQQRDANGNAITLSYDDLNRVLSKNNIRYYYDENTKGTLSRVVTPQLTIRYYYDQRLRNIKEEKIIDGITFTTEYAYDSMNRIISKKLPNNEVITYAYDNQGNLKQLGNIASIKYNQLNQPVSRTYANNLVTDLTYDSKDFRLNRIKTSNLQDLNYKYDNVGNILEINNLVKNRKEEMNYDDLDRLTSAKMGNDFNLGYTYDSIGNMLSIKNKDSGEEITFSYGILAHAPNKVTGLNETQSDSDRDGFPDNIDNCPYNHNPNQEDADGDGIGNACDTNAIVCNVDSDCGTNGWIEQPYCTENKNIYRKYLYYTCNNRGTSTAYCSNSTTMRFIQSCIDGNDFTADICQAGACSNPPIICSRDENCNDSNPKTKDICNYPGELTSSCSNVEINTNLRMSIAYNWEGNNKEIISGWDEASCEDKDACIYNKKCYSSGSVYPERGGPDCSLENTPGKGCDTVCHDGRWYMCRSNIDYLKTNEIIEGKACVYGGAWVPYVPCDNTYGSACGWKTSIKRSKVYNWEGNNMTIISSWDEARCHENDCVYNWKCYQPGSFHPQKGGDVETGKCITPRTCDTVCSNGVWNTCRSNIDGVKIEDYTCKHGGVWL